MNNEPVAYRHLHEDGWEYYDAPTGEDCKDCIALYTHPAKTLTDEEIIAISNGCLVGATAWHNPDLDPIEFARAVLRKAQEK
jgi:hypothetical protein